MVRDATSPCRADAPVGGVRVSRAVYAGTFQLEADGQHTVAIAVCPAVSLTWRDAAPVETGGDSPLSLQPGAVSVISRRRPVHVRLHAPAEVLVIALDAGLVDRYGTRMSADAPRPLPLRTTIGCDDAVAEWLGHSLHAQHAAAPADAPSTDAMRRVTADAFVRHLIRQYGDGAWAEALRPATLDRAPWLQRLQHHVAARPCGDSSPEALARTLHISSSALKRRVERDVGLSVYGFIACLRIRAARRLLLETDLPLAAIARRLGFRREAQLVRLFLSTYGLHPERYRDA
ncbi:MAG: helix-turn-helix domain-containing protein [Bacteroidetes bacterium]|jgi:AraC-like DNA-binding protein|nr:helix-turn-helix domain-containing protein [Bacteroidota bacterium]